MEKGIVQSIEQMVENKLLLYHDLRDCLERERGALIDVDVDALWSISSEKDALCLEISKLRKAIAAAAKPWCRLEPFDLNVLISYLPGNQRNMLQQAVPSLSRLKGEIEGLRAHNMVFMNDSLQFLDEMIGIISGAAGTGRPVAYDRRCALNSRKSTYLLRQEV